MSFDFNRLAEALIGGAAQPPARRRRRAAAPFGRSRSGQAQAVRALASLAGMAIEALTTAGQAPPPQAETPRGPPPRSEKPRPPPQAGKTSPPPQAGKTSPLPQADKPRPPRRLPDTRPPLPPAPRAEQAEALLLIRAMVAAAAAHGQVDRTERQAIAAQLDQAGLTPAERDLVLADLEHPATPESLAADVQDPMQAAQVYAAAVAVAAEPSAAERGFLDRLCRALRLSPTAAAAIETRLTGTPAP